MELIPILLAVFVIGFASRYVIKRVTVYEYERGLKYTNGRFRGLLQPGLYWHFPYFTTITKVDVRPRSVTIPGQEVLSSDSVGLKVSLAMTFQVVDPAKAINTIQDFLSALHLELQVALRIVIGSATIDELLERRNELGARLLEMTTAKCSGLGVQLQSVSIKDIMFPGALKSIFTQVVKAKKEGLAAVEKARGETAALRNLANAAELVERVPALLQLRALHSSEGNTILFGMPANGGPIPLKARSSKSSPEGTAPSTGE
ncbi:MAG TPA: slipin family protein [Nitrospira sp.]|nr:slipin family protein [Nitrospira sp.]